jgi:hypothetical protein
MKRSLFLGLVVLTCGALAVDASWLSDISGINIDIPAGKIEVGTPNPAAIPRMLENLPKDLGQALLNPSGTALATAIRHAEAQASHGAQPVPNDVRSLLAPFIPVNILNGARWNVYDPGRITLDSIILGIFQREGAVTLNNVIVFSSAPSINDYRLWAHELTHVLQYQNMGVEGFASIYSVNSESIENEARRWEQHVGWTIDNQRSQQPQGWYQEPQWQQQRFYSMRASVGSRQLTNNDFAAAAQQYYPPESCVTTQESPQALWVRNICPIPVRVTGWQQQHPYTGVLMPIVCTTNCWVAPGVNAPFWSTAPGPMVTVGYSYH